MPPAKSITLQIDFNTFTVKTSFTVWMNELWLWQNALMSTILTADWLYDWLPACNNGYPLTKNQQVVFV